MKVNTPLSDEVKTWLGTQGYPLEMRVAAALREVGFSVIQSAYFEDPSLGKARELDVIAYRRWHCGGIEWQLTLLIECKVSKTQPWVLFTRTRETQEIDAQHEYYRTQGSVFGRQLLLQLRRLGQARHEVPLLEFDGRPGYGVQQIALVSRNSQKVERRDVAFEAATKIVRASALHAAAVDTEEYADTPIGQIVLPVIVVDAGLFDVHLNDAGELVVCDLEQGILDWNNPVAASRPTWVRVVTATALDTFVADARRTADFLSEGCNDVLSAIAERWRQRYEAKHAAGSLAERPHSGAPEA